jgi:hypothetical protein
VSNFGAPGRDFLKCCYEAKNITEPTELTALLKVARTLPPYYQGLAVLTLARISFERCPGPYRHNALTQLTEALDDVGRTQPSMLPPGFRQALQEFRDVAKIYREDFLSSPAAAVTRPDAHLFSIANELSIEEDPDDFGLAPHDIPGFRDLEMFAIYGLTGLAHSPNDVSIQPGPAGQAVREGKNVTEIAKKFGIVSGASQSKLELDAIESLHRDSPGSIVRRGEGDPETVAKTFGISSGANLRLLRDQVGRGQADPTPQAI